MTRTSQWIGYVLIGLPMIFGYQLATHEFLILALGQSIKEGIYHGLYSKLHPRFPAGWLLLLALVVILSLRLSSVDRAISNALEALFFLFLLASIPDDISPSQWWTKNRVRCKVHFKAAYAHMAGKVSLGGGPRLGVSSASVPIIRHIYEGLKPYGLLKLFIFYSFVRTVLDFSSARYPILTLLSPLVLYFLNKKIPLNYSLSLNFIIIIFSISFILLWIFFAGENGIVGHIPLKIKNSMIMANVLIFPFMCINLWSRRLWVLASILLTATILFGVRTGMVALVSAMTTFIFAHYFSRFTVVCLMVLLGIISLVSLFMFDLFYNNPVSSLLGEHYHSFYERIVVWKNVQQLAKDHPWWGVGPTTLTNLLREPITYVYKGNWVTTRIVHSHHLLLEIRASLGLVGYVLAIAALFQGMVAAYRCPDRWTPFWLSCGVYVFVLMNCFLSFFKDPWILAFVGLVALCIREMHTESHPSLR